MNDPGLVTADWIRTNKDQRWNNTEKQRVKDWLRRKTKMERLDTSNEWTVQVRECRMIARRHGVRLR